MACFNGAATCSLRKALVLTGRHGRACGFNGAATCSLRKEEGGNCNKQEVIASMGPQLVRCGKEGYRQFCAARPDGFNGAATCSLRKGLDEVTGPGAPAMLQWGRNLFVAERSQEVTDMGLDPEASMGPQLVRCGKSQRAWGGGAPDPPLQWGRNLFVAESPCSA